jgi:hypothetical protein
MANSYYSSGYKYKTTNKASMLMLDGNGSIELRVAPSGTEDSAITWTTAMTVTNTGNVGIGTSPSSPLHVSAAMNTGWLAQFINTGTGTDANGVLIKAGVDNSDYILRLQTQSGAEVLQVKYDGRGLSQFTAKVWCKFNGIGTVGISDSHNTSSITDVGTGVYRVNFTNAMANTSYAAFASAQGGHASQPDGWSTTYVQFSNRSASNTSLDGAHLAILVFGD